MPELILALDVGTTTARAAVISPEGRILSLKFAPLATTSPGPGLAEQDAEAVWRCSRRLMRAALAGSGRTANDLAGLGLTTQRASAVVWDNASGRAAAPMVLWSDLRGTSRAAEMQAAGHFVAAQQPAAKLEAILATTGAGQASLAFGTLDSWLIWKLSGGAAHVTDRSQAWPTGYLALADLGWNAELIGLQGLERLAFPALVDTWGVIGVSARGVLGAPVPITADVADQQAALIAHGEAPGTAKITWGTSGTLDVATSGPVFAALPALPPLIVSSAAGRTAFCLEGMILSAGSALDWLRRTFALGSAPGLDALAAKRPDGAGVHFLPALQGLGAPHGEPSRLGRLTGLSTGVDRPAIARAAYEGLAFRAREILERAQAAGALDGGSAIGVDGGLARGETFLQVLADLVSRPIRPLATPEATLLGAALLARRGAGQDGEGPMRAAMAGSRIFAPKLEAAEASERFAAWRAAVHGG